MTQYTELLDNDPRAQRLAHWQAALEVPGFCFYSVFGEQGDYYDLVYQNVTLYEMPSVTFLLSGKTESVGEEDGVRFLADPDHNDPCHMNEDGSFGAICGNYRYNGRRRFFLLGNPTHRLCVVPTDVFGTRTFEPLVWTRYRDEQSFVLAQGSVFVLTNGVATVDGNEATGFSVTVAQSGDKTVVMQAGARGTAISRASS